MTAMTTKDITTNETAARAYFEGIRWPNGPFCPHCGEAKKVYRLEGKSHRPGLFHCNGCAGQFTVTTGSVMESSHIPLSKWALGFRLYAASKKGFSAHQLHRMLGITYKSAWFMAMRIREAMGDQHPGPVGGSGKTVEADETYIGRKPGKVKKAGGGGHKMAVISLVERGGVSRSFPLEDMSMESIHKAVTQNVKRDSHLRTDEYKAYIFMAPNFASHETVKHSADEYVRGDIHTNTVEGFFSIFKRGMKGVYQHCSEQHLHRYLAEFDFRYSNRMAVGVDDLIRTMRAIKGAEGKRLTYRQAGRKAA
jgi:transposase-like protein